MPELPEVETIKRIIEPQIKGQKILSVVIGNPQVIAYPKAHDFAQLLQGQMIKNMSRRGKFLTAHFENGDRMVLHLRMTGQLLVTPADFPAQKHTHLLCNLSGGNQIRYIDTRRFGRFWYLQADEEDTVTGQSKLGLEALSDELNGAYLKQKNGKSRKAVKEMLLDQSVVAGIGNIYSDEILYAAEIFPEKKCMDLSDRDWELLAKKTREVIAWGILANKMTAEEYLSGMGKEYSNIPGLKAYGREEQPCKRCGTLMAGMVIGGRSSCYCPKCQKAGE